MKHRAAHNIILSIADEFGVDVSDIKAPGRGMATASRARQEAYRRIREELGYSLPVIGRIFDRDHTTILHGIRAAAKRRAA